MLQPSKSYWAFYRQSVAASRAFLGLVVGGSALVPVLVCAMLPSPGIQATILRLLLSWAGLGSSYFTLTLLLVWVDYCDSKNRRGPVSSGRRPKSAGDKK
jgi:hypothetical protein